MIDDNRKEQSWILAGAWADAESIVTAGALEHVKDAERAAEFLKTLKEAAGAVGKLTDIKDAMEDFKGNDLGLKVSDSLKELLDLLSANPALAELGTANNVVDLGIKASQWRALQVENDELLKVLVQLKRAQDQLLAKDPVTRAKIEAAARKATQEAEQRQRVQSDLLRDYYKDKPQTIELAVRGASKRSAQAAMQVASGLQIAGRAQNAFDLSKIRGINPAAIAAINRCNSIAASMVQRQANLTAIRNRCPKPERPGGDPPPCPEYEAAAAQNARTNQASMTCNKDSSGQYIPLFTSPKPGHSIAGSWSLLPGSYYTGERRSEQELQQYRQANYGALYDITEIEPGHFRTVVQIGSKTYPIDLNGSEDKASGDREVDLEYDEGGRSFVRDKYVFHVDALLTDGTLYYKETATRNVRRLSGSEPAQVYYREAYSIARPTASQGRR